MFLFSVHAAVLFYACLATDSVFTLHKTRKDKKPHFFIVNGHPSSNINDKHEIIMNEPQLEKQANSSNINDKHEIIMNEPQLEKQANSSNINDKHEIMNEPHLEKQAISGINWNEKYKLLNVYRRRLKKTTVKNHERNFDSFAMPRKHNAPLSNNTRRNTKETRKHKLDAHRLYKRILRDIVDTSSGGKQYNTLLSNKTDNSTEETKNNSRVLVSGKEIANYAPLILSVFTRVPSNNPEVEFNNKSLSDKNSLVSTPEPKSNDILLVTKHEPETNKSLQETNSEPNKLTHADSNLKLVLSEDLSLKDVPKYALFVNYDLLNSSNKMDPNSNENTAIITPAPQIYEPYPFTYEPVKNGHLFQPETGSHFDPPLISNVESNGASNYEPVKNRHQFQPEDVSLFKLATISADKSILYDNYSPFVSYFYLPPLVSSVAIAPHQTRHGITNGETKPYLNNKPSPISNFGPPRLQNYESATYYHNKPEINYNPEPKISNYNSAMFEPQQLSDFEPDNLQPATYNAPSNYDPVNYEQQPYEPRNDEPQNYETSHLSNREPQAYERLPSKQLVYNYSHQSHLDNLQNEGVVEILDVVYDDDEREAEIIEAMNKQTLVMEKLANVIDNENRRKMKLSRGEKHFNELLDEIEEWHNKTSTTPKQKQQKKNATKVTPSIISVVDETEIRKALKENPLVKRVLKMAARKRKEYIDAVKKYYNITT